MADGQEAVSTRLHHSEQTVGLLAGANEKMSTTIEVQNTTIHVLSATIERMLTAPDTTPEEAATTVEDVFRVAVEWASLEEENRERLHDRLRDALAHRRWNQPFDELDTDTQHTIQQLVNATIEELDRGGKAVVAKEPEDKDDSR